MSDVNQAKKSVDILFADDVVRPVRPLTIAKLRKFVKAMAELDEVRGKDVEKPMDDETMTKMVDAAAIVLEKDYPELVANREELEDALDLETFGKIMAIAMGNRLEAGNE